MGVLVACGGTTIVVAPTPEPEPTPEPTPETLSIEEKEYYRQICEDTLGAPPVSWEDCDLAIEVVSERVSSDSTRLSKEEILMFTTSWFRCEAEVRTSDLEYNRYDFFRTFTYDGVEYEYVEAIPIDLDNLRGYSGPGYNSFSNSTSKTAVPQFNISFIGCW